MSSKDRKTPLKIPLAQVLTSYLVANHITQVDLAEFLNVDERTLRRWKNGEVVLTDIRELKRIADILGISPERLGVASEAVPFTEDQIDSVIEHIWKQIRAANYHNANVLVDRLLVNITELIQTEDVSLLAKIASIQHIAGFVKSQITRSNQSSIPFSHYSEMERIARIIGNDEMLIIALTYEGDMLQRGGNVLEALTYLEEAINIPASIGARGNATQLLGRAYFKAQRLSDFERAMKDSEALAFDPVLVDPTNSVKGQFSAGTVYEEYARSLGLLGQTNAAMDYIDKAEKVFAQQWIKQRRDMLIKTTKSIILVHGGEIREGVEVAVEATELCRQAGNIRLLDRIYGVQKYLDRLTREIGHSGSILREALDGPVEY